MSQETATPNALAENQGESAPQQVEQQHEGQNQQAVDAESATANDPQQSVDGEQGQPSQPGEQGEPGEAKPEQSGAVKELIAQRKKRQKAEQEAAYWRGVAEAKAATSSEQVATGKSQPVEQPQFDPNEPVAPDIRSYENYEDYEKAKDHYIINRAKYQLRKEMDMERAKEQQSTIEASFKQLVAKAIEEDPEFADIVSDPSLPISNPMASLIQESEVGPQIIRWLSENREEAKQISGLDPMRAARRIGSIEATLQAKPAAAPAGKKISQAPAPIKTVTPAGATVVDEDDLPMAEYYKRRTQQLLKGK